MGKKRHRGDPYQNGSRSGDKVYRDRLNSTGSGQDLSGRVVKNGHLAYLDLPPRERPGVEEGSPPLIADLQTDDRGVSAIYSSQRIKHPLVRGRLLDLWREFSSEQSDPVALWELIVNNPEFRRRWQRSRGQGGFRRVNWDTAVEIMAAALVSTIKNHGPDRITGYSSSPDSGMIRFAAGSRFLHLLGGVMLTNDQSDLVGPAETWGEQCDLPELANWYNAKHLTILGEGTSGFNAAELRTITRAGQNGCKIWNMSRNVGPLTRVADEVIDLDPTDAEPFWLAVNHVVLNEFHHLRRAPYFWNYVTHYTDSPFLVELIPQGDFYRSGPLLRADRVPSLRETENNRWQFVVRDTIKERWTV
jgi:nitrate reductase alpha subunit